MEKIFSFVWKLIKQVITSSVSFVVVRILKKDLTPQKWNNLFQFVKFCLVGVLNTAISLLTYYLFIWIDTDLYIIGNIAGFFASVINSYYWNSRYVFSKTDEKAKTLIKTFIAYGTNLILGTALLVFFVDVLLISKYIAPLLNLCLTIPLNYLLNKFWVMKRTGSKKVPQEASHEK